MRIKRTGVSICLIAGFCLVLGIWLLLQTKGGQTIFGLFTLNNSRIVFYGKLEDQFGSPIANTTVNFDVRVNNGFRTGVDRGSVISDADGMFKISGFSGSRLWVVPSKDGYAIASETREAIYSDLWPTNQRAHPDPKKPVVIKMWKVQGAEPLIGFNGAFKLPYTNTPIYFDILKEVNVSSGGDIAITVIRPTGIISQQHPQPWSVKIDVIDGGIMDSAGTGTITYFAPESGYQPSRTIPPFDGFASTGINGFSGGFYIKSRKGQVYAKLTISFGINSNPEDLMYIAFKGIANTNYSRNWEGASGTYLNPGY